MELMSEFPLRQRMSTYMSTGKSNETEFVKLGLYRKSYHSINVGVACDYNLRFIWLSAKYGGSAHDSRVFRESALHNLLNSGRSTGILLADSAYRAEKFILKPILNPSSIAGKF